METDGHSDELIMQQQRQIEKEVKQIQTLSHSIRDLQITKLYPT